VQARFGQARSAAIAPYRRKNARYGQRRRTCLARCDTDLTAESAFCSNRVVEASGLRLFAATASRWTKTRASGTAIASSTHMRIRRVRKTHMCVVYPAGDRLNRRGELVRLHCRHEANHVPAGVEPACRRNGRWPRQPRRNSDDDRGGRVRQTSTSWHRPRPSSLSRCKPGWPRRVRGDGDDDRKRTASRSLAT
jgi:hypothetical protein